MSAMSDSDSETARTVRIRLDLANEEAEEFLYVQKHLGLKNSTEVVRFVIRAKAEELRRGEEPELEHFNLDEHGVRILDRRINRVVDIFFKPQGVRCEYCKEKNCRHIKFALTVPAIQEVVIKRRKEGWKLPLPP